MHPFFRLGFRHGASRLVLPLSVVLVFGPVGFGPAAADDGVERISGKTLTILRDRENVIVNQGDRLLIRYRYADVPRKPYVAEMTAPSGVNLLRDAPSDHLHHHALMFAWGVDGVNFWEEREGAGWQVHQGWKDLKVVAEGGMERAVLRERLLWKTADGKVLLNEDRTLIVPATAEGRPRMLTWQADFTPGKDAARTLTIAGAKYNGLGARFIRSMDAPGGLHFNSTGGKQVAGTNGKQAEWSAYAAPVAPGHHVTAAMFNAPTNPRHPSEFFTMGEQPPFAYLANTLGVGTEPLKLEPGKTMSVRFGVAVFEALADAGQIGAVYRDWAARWRK